MKSVRHTNNEHAKRAEVHRIGVQRLKPVSAGYSSVFPSTRLDVVWFVDLNHCFRSERLASV